MEDSIKIQAQLEPKTLKRGIKAVLDNSKAVKTIQFIGIGIIVFCLGLFVAFKFKSYAPFQGVFIGFVLVYFSNIMSYFNARKVQADDKIFEKLTYEFKIDTILITGETFEGYLDWALINNVVETKEFFLLYQSAIGASIIPKNAFTEVEATDFRELITTLPGLKNNILD